PGHNLEFEGNFSGGPYQHVGFGTDFTGSTPTATFSTRGGGPLHAYTTVPTDSGTVVQDTELTGDWLGGWHDFLIDWAPDSVTYFIDGTVVATHSVALGADLRPLVSDFQAGDGGVSVDWLRMSPYTAAGTFQSRV